MNNDDQVRDDELTEIDQEQISDPLNDALSTDENIKLENKLAADAEQDSRPIGSTQQPGVQDENVEYAQAYESGVDEADTDERREADNQPQP